MQGICIYRLGDKEGRMGPKTIEMEKVEGGMGDYCAPARGTMEIMRPEGHIMPPEGCIMPPEG